MSQRDLAETVGVSVGGMHYILNAQIEKGLVKVESYIAMQDKRRYAYILTPKSIAGKTPITKRSLERKMQEYKAVKAEIDTPIDKLDDDTVPDRSGGRR